MKQFNQRAKKDHAGFTLVELLVVIGIIAVLIGLLMPALTRARAQANSVKCMANLHVLGQMLEMYEGENKGYLYPVGPVDPATGHPSTLGTNVPPDQRWPMILYKLKGAPEPPPYDSSAFPVNVPRAQAEAVMAAYPAAPYTPEGLVCPADFEPWEAHSYVLNSHLSDRTLKAGSHDFGGLTSSDVIVAGEKVTTERDYYMEAGPPGSQGVSEFDRVVEKYRHGVQLGSNYLYHDHHVGTLLPPDALTGIDPWDLKTAPTTQQGT